MIRTLFDKVIVQALSPFYLWKHGGIWGLQKHLAQNDNPDARFLRIYSGFFHRYGSSIGYSAQLADIPYFPHNLYGIFISRYAKIGKNTVIFQHVTIGSNTLNASKKAGAPTIGDNVYIGAGAKIIGNVTVGDNCRIGANAVVYRDLPPHSVAVQASTRIIQKSNLDNRFYRKNGDKLVYYQNRKWIEVDQMNDGFSTTPQG